MKRAFHRLPLILLGAVALACGAAATLPPQLNDASLATRLQEAVWYAEEGDHTNLAVSGNAVLAEDGVTHLQSIVVLPPGDASGYVNGAFSILVPDRERVTFDAKVGLPSGSGSSVVFSAYIQNGTEFPLLAQVTASPDGHLDPLTFDLTPFRGKSVLLILATASADSTPLTTSALWVEPQILTP